MQAGAKIESGCSYFENSDRPHVWFEEGYTKLRQVQGGLAHPDSKANFAASDTSYDTVVQEVNKAISTLEAMFSKLAEGHQQGMSR